MKRFLLRAAIAAGVTAALVFAITPPHYLRDQFEIRPDRLTGQIAAVFAVVFALVFLGDAIGSWAKRGPRTLRASGILSFVTGLVSGMFALTLWLAFLAVPVAPIGIGAAWVALRAERANKEGHSLLNLAGLLLNVTALGVFASQIITATIWR